MERLRAQELRGLVEFLHDGYGVHDLDSFVRQMIEGLPRLVPCYAIAYSQIDLRRQEIAWTAEPDAATRFPGGEEALGRHIADHPVAREFVRTGRPRWSRISDHLSRRQYHDAGIYQDFFRHVKVEYQAGVLFPERGSLSTAVALSRTSPDFTDREMVVLELLRPCIERAWRNAEALTAVRDDLAMLRRGMESMRLGLIGLGRDGRIQSVSERAADWMRAYFGASPRRADQLPDVLSRWLREQRREDVASAAAHGPGAFVATREGGRLVVRLLRHGEHDVLALAEDLDELRTTTLRGHGLSPREVDVAKWLAEGKTNPEIAVILALSPRTVQHHVEKILRKLGVETRTAAALRVRDTACSVNGMA